MDNLGLWISMANMVIFVVIIIWTIWFSRRILAAMPASRVEAEHGEDLAAFDVLGMPELRLYRPDEFEQPLLCLACKYQIREGSQYYDVPLPAAKREGAMFAMCIPCSVAPGYRVAP